MNQKTKQHYNSYLFEYLKQEFSDLKYNLREKQHTCPVCKHTEKCANIFPKHNPKIKCLNPSCNFEGDLFDLVKHTKKGFSKSSSKAISDYLKFKLKIEPLDDPQELLDFYESQGFALIPILQGNEDSRINKMPPKNFEWRNKVYKDKRIWKDWLERGWGLALVLGEDSGVDGIDFDDMKTKDELEDIFDWETLTQQTKKGIHLLYKHDPEINKTLNKVLKEDGYQVEYRTSGAYIVVAPSSTAGEKREWNYKEVKPMPKKAKDFFLKYLNSKGKSVETDIDENIQEAIDSGKVKNKLNGLDGCCNDTFIQVAGILRKTMRMRDVATAMTVFNSVLANPMNKHTINTMLEQIDKYNTYDKEELATLVLERLDKVKSATAYQVASAIKQDQVDVEDAFKYLEDEGKIIHEGQNRYSRTNEVEWTTDVSDMSVPVDYIVPYFHDYNHFDFGNMIIIGGCSGTGKTALAANFINEFVKQGINPDVVTTEAGSKLGKSCDIIGVPKGSFFVPKNPVTHPNDIELRDNKVTIIDWLRPRDGQYDKLGLAYENLHEQLKKHSGLLIVFAQLRKENNKFFAPDQVEHFGSFVCKYLFGDNGKDAINTYFKVEKMRDSKIDRQYIEIPTHYDRETRIVTLRKDYGTNNS